MQQQQENLEFKREESDKKAIKEAAISALSRTQVRAMKIAFLNEEEITQDAVDVDAVTFPANLQSTITKGTTQYFENQANDMNRRLGCTIQKDLFTKLFKADGMACAMGTQTGGMSIFMFRPVAYEMTEEEEH